MGFPIIPGVRFSAIKGHASGSRRYAVSSDGRVWIGSGSKWSVVESYIDWEGSVCVWLNSESGFGGMRVRVNGLVEKHFP